MSAVIYISEDHWATFEPSVLINKQSSLRKERESFQTFTLFVSALFCCCMWTRL